MALAAADRWAAEIRELILTTLARQRGAAAAGSARRCRAAGPARHSARWPGTRARLRYRKGAVSPAGHNGAGGIRAVRAPKVRGRVYRCTAAMYSISGQVVSIRQSDPVILL
jgi:hypothetical protein